MAPRKPPPLPPLTVDTREPRTIDRLLEAEGFTVDRTKLDTGDYLWVNAAGVPVLVERKTVPDLLGSITGYQRNRKTRAQNQLARLREFPIPVLLIEGYPKLSANGYIMRAYTETRWLQVGLDNWLLTVQDMGIRVAYARQGKVAERLRYLATYYDKPKHGGV